MKKTLLSLVLWLPLFCVEAAEPSSISSTLRNAVAKDVPAETLRDQARKALLDENLDESIRLYSSAVARQQETRSQGRQVSPELLGEYAYALALAQAQAEALKTVDLALNLSDLKEVPEFYIYSVLYVIGNPDEAETLAGCKEPEWCAKAPKWLNGQGCRLNDRYAAPSAIIIPDAASGLKELRFLTSKNRKIEALAYGAAFMKQYPRNQFGYLLSSSVWENLKCYTQAYLTFEKGYALAGSEGSLLSKEAMLPQYNYLKEQSQKKGNKRAFSPPVMTYIYGGVGYGSKNFTMQARYGLTQGPLSVSLDASMSIPSKGKVSYSFGVTGYYRWKILVAGLGMAFYDKSFAFTPTVGMSFYNHSHTSSLDIMLTSYLPVSGRASCGFTLSIGKSFYFKL